MTSPLDTGAVSPDGRAALVTFDLTGEAAQAVTRVEPVLESVARVQTAYPDLRIEQFGPGSGQKWFGDAVEEDLKRAEWSAVPLAGGILLVTFGALVAAALPVVLALTAYIAAAGLVAVSSHLFPTYDDAYSVMLLVGLAVGVDYCLFYVCRVREERARGHGPEEALRIAAATSGRAVVVSGLTVVISMTGMFLTGLANFQAVGLATIVVVVVAAIGSVTVLPALLAMLGDRVEGGAVPLLRRRSVRRRRVVIRGHVARHVSSGPPPPGSRVWRFLLSRVLRRPLAAAALSVAALLGLAAPLLTMETAQLTLAQELPPDHPLVRTEARISSAFPAGPAPARVVVRAEDVSAPQVEQALEELEQQALATGRLYGPVQLDVHEAEDVVVVDIPMAGNGNDEASTAALRALRETVVPQTLGQVPGVETAVTGLTATSFDFNDRLRRSALPVFAFVLGLTFLVMLLSFRSIVVAAVSVVLNLLSVGATYGVLALVFQHGFGLSLVGGHSVGVVAAWIPLFLFVILFGLSVDYHVFMISRIREGYAAGLSTPDAIISGITATAGVVSSAAVIMVGVFSIFGTLSMQSLKQVGVGLAVAVLIDATVIRGVLLPAVMTLLGDWNWYLPRWLRWVPDLSHQHPGGTPPVRVPVQRVPGSEEPVLA